MVTIKVGEFEATIENYQWRSDFEPLAQTLNALLNPLGPSGADPNPDYSAALHAIEVLGGEILSFDDASFDADVVY